MGIFKKDNGKIKPQAVAGGGIVTVAMASAAVFLGLAGPVGKPVTEKFENIELVEYYDTSDVLSWCGGETQVGRLPKGQFYTYEYCKALFDAQWDKYSAQMYSCYTADMAPFITVAMHVAFTDTFYNTGAKCSSGMMRAIRRGDPVAACGFLKEYRKSRTPRGGRLDGLDGKIDGYMDCSLTKGEPKGCYGIWTRRVEFADMCLAEAQKLPPGGLK